MLKFIRLFQSNIFLFLLYSILMTLLFLCFQERLIFSPTLIALIALSMIIILILSFLCIKSFALQKQILEKQLDRQTLELKEALKTAKAASQSKSDFLASMSHELRTPLNAILGFSSTMQHQAFGPIENPIYIEYANRIYKSGEYLLSLINDILDLSKMEATAQKPKKEWLILDEVLADVLQIISGYPSFNERKLIIEEHQALPKLMADSRMVRQVLLNVLSNAIKFTEKGGIIRIKPRITPAYELSVAITDNGIGIPANKVSEVLKPFVQLENVMTRKHQGSGLGLALVDRLMKLHQGRVEIQSRLGKGTTVALIFPSPRLEQKGNIIVK